MPYIKQVQRNSLDGAIDSLVNLLEAGGIENMDGEFNYVITRLAKSLYAPKYFNYNRAIGVLECAKLELYRAVIGVYEEMKREDNSDVVGKILHRR